MQDAEKRAWGRWSAASLHLEWVSPPELSVEVRKLIDHLWKMEADKAAARGRVLFDGPIAALAGWEQRDAALVLKLYPAKYSEFQITCVRHADRFDDQSRRPAVGSSILLAQGGKALLGLRGRSVAAYPDHLHIFGGIITLAEGTTGLDIMHELQREMREELDLTPADLVTAPLLCGLLYEPNLHQPELVWMAAIRSGRTVELAVNHEHSALVRVSVSELKKPDFPHAVTPVARKTLELLQG